MTHSIDVDEALNALPHFETFCSLEKIEALVERLRGDDRFRVSEAGRGAGGHPIHLVRFGNGRRRVLVVAGPHAHEVIGGLTAYGLLDLLQNGCPGLVDADIEWNVVPCIDPQGAKLNEGWSQAPFDVRGFVQGMYVESPRKQVDSAFPISYKALLVTEPCSAEAWALKAILDEVRPDFYYCLHSAFAGGAFFLCSVDLGRDTWERLYDHLRRFDFPLRLEPQWSEFLAQYSTGVSETYRTSKHYDYVAAVVERPEESFTLGGTSSDYLESIKPEAITFMAEFTYFMHPMTESTRQTDTNLRRFKLQIEAEAKYIGSLLMEAWSECADDLDRNSPFYEVAANWIVPSRQRIVDGGLPLSRYPTRDTLFNPAYSRAMTEGEKFNACVVNDGLKLLAVNHQLVRLLDASPATPRIVKARRVLERAFNDAISVIDREVGLGAIEVFDCDRLARLQLGSGLIALNAFLGR